MTAITCFKAYDVRGRVPDQLNEAIARRIGRAYAQVIEPRQVVVGHDIRLSSEAIKAALVQGLVEQGVDVYDIGLCGTEEIRIDREGYCATYEEIPEETADELDVPSRTEDVNWEEDEDEELELDELGEDKWEDLEEEEEEARIDELIEDSETDMKIAMMRQ